MPVASLDAERPSWKLEGGVGERDALIEVLRAQVAELEARLAERDAVIAELRARLDQNSRSSSRPPSSDGYSKPSASRNRSLRRRSGRKPGGQPGHPGRHLERREDPDEAIAHAVERCECCGRDLSDMPIVESQSRQVFDLPEVPTLHCVEHWIQKRRCPCGHATSSSFPAGVTAPVCYGPWIRAMGIYLVSYQHLPYVRAAEILSDWARAPISVGTLQAFVAQGAEGLEEFLGEVRSQLEGAEVAHFDETGGRIAGELGWIHCASTDGLTLYTVHSKRGCDGINAAGVLPGFEGTAVHDGWTPYRLYEKARHALCGAHHLRELLGAEEQGQSWAAAMSALLLDTKEAVDRARAAGEGRLGDRALAGLGDCYRDVIALGYEQNPGLKPDQGGRHPKRTKAQNLLLRLDQREQETLRFAHDFRVPFDNNLCERDLRMVKLQQKISGCWRTTAGAARFLAIRSYLSTARKQDQRPVRVACAERRPAVAAAGRRPLKRSVFQRPDTPRAMSKRSRRRAGSPPRPQLQPARPATSRPPTPPAQPERLLLDQIAAGALDPHLTAIAEAVHARYELLQTVSSAKALAMLNVGDRVRINHHASPRYLEGVHGIVVELDGHTATVCVHRPVGRFRTGEIRCPPLVLDRLDPAA